MASTNSTLGTIFSRGSIVIVLVLFAMAGVVARNQMEHNTVLQQQLRTAAIERSRVLLLQIDEETGVRGFAVTGEPALLAPYKNARRMFLPTALTFLSTLKGLGIDATAAQHEIEINQEWNTAVADPLLKDRARNNTLSVHMRGKVLVDRFRAEDQALATTLVTAENNADARSTRNTEIVLFSFLAAGLLVALGVAILVGVQARTSSELEEQRRLTDVMQDAFMRLELPKLRRAELDAVYVPAELEAKVGGDWYDAFELREGLILLTLGDVAGHGIEAAVVMSRVRQAILAISIVERNPAAVLTLVNEILLLQDAAVVTAVCAFVDLDRKLIEYSTAGHPPIIVARSDGSVEKLPFWGPPLGATDDVAYRTFTTDVHPDDLVVLYTDGLLEQNKNIERGEKRLLDAVSIVHTGKPPRPAAALKDAVLADEAPRDDVAILTMKFRKELYANKMVANG